MLQIFPHQLEGDLPAASSHGDTRPRDQQTCTYRGDVLSCYSVSSFIVIVVIGVMVVIVVLFYQIRVYNFQLLIKTSQNK